VTTTTRQRMIDSAADVIAERGFEAASFTEIINRAGTTRGVIYHHFPGGKYQLAEEVLARSGRAAQAFIEAVRAADDPLTAVRAYVNLWRDSLEASSFQAGCPVVAVVADASADNPTLRQAADEAFSLWRAALATVLQRGGIAAVRAARLATVAISAVEGAVLVCRASRRLDPLDDVGNELDSLIRAALPPKRRN
jgi:AcrR family transcriptional regulator